MSPTKLLLGLTLATTACTDMDEPQLSVIESQVAVSNYVSSTCSTSVVVGLSRQIAEEIGCMQPDSLVELTPGTNVSFSSNAVLPYMSAKAKTALLKVAQTKHLQINSGFRSVVQQYLLYRWNQQGRCGITAAARPGNSNHESGRAVDISNYSAVKTAMRNQGWSASVPGDPVHFDFLGSPDIRGRDVKAFQRLWNRNNPGDKIGEDGSYGPQTESRLKQAPATGFELGATCAPRASGASVVMIEGPDRVAPNTRAHYSLTVTNYSSMDWPASTKLVVAGGNSSELFDEASWESTTVLGEIGSEIGAGAMGIIEIDVATPDVTEETPLFTQFELVDGTDNFGTINVALTVTPDGDEDTSADAKDQHDPGAEVTGGCNAGGGGPSGLALLMPALALLRRRRRA